MRPAHRPPDAVINDRVDYVAFDTSTAAGAEATAAGLADLELLHDAPVELAVEIGRARMTTGEVLALRCGSIVTLNRLAGEPVDLLINGKPIARGEVVVIEEQLGLRINDVVAPDRRLATRW